MFGVEEISRLIGVPPHMIGHTTKTTSFGSGIAEQGMAFVPGAAFYADAPQASTLRLSFVTVSPERIGQGVAALARTLELAHRKAA